MNPWKWSLILIGRVCFPLYSLNWTLRDLQFLFWLLKGSTLQEKERQNFSNIQANKAKNGATAFTKRKNMIPLQAELCQEYAMLLLPIRFCPCLPPSSTPSSLIPGLNTPAAISPWLTGNRVAPMVDCYLPAGQGKAGPQ